LFFLQHNLQIFIDDEANQAVDFNLIKIAELQRFGTEVKISTQYIPPVLEVGASPVLNALLREIKEQVTTRARELALYKQDKGLENIQLGTRDMVYLLALLTLNRYTPLLHHLLESAGVSPWNFYSVLRQIVGELSTYSTSYNVFGGRGIEAEEGLPTYQHDDLAGCFGMAMSSIIRIMDELTAGPDYVAQLLFDGTYFAADLNERIFAGNNRYYLRIKSDLPADQVINALRISAKLSSREYLPILIARSLPGVNFEYDGSPPTELPRSTDSVYFRVDHHGAPWDAVRNGLNAAIYFDTPPGQIEIELMVIYGK
jgi:type VI secretion system protein ImpJ